MKTNNLFNLSIIIGISVLLSSCSAKKSEEKESGNGSSNAVEIVKTMTVSKENVLQSVDFTATLLPFEEVYLAPASPGRIEKLNVEIGDYVTKGQIVAIMDRTNLEQARINMLKLEADFKRLDTLKKTGSIADQQYDQIKSAYEIAKTTYNFLLGNTQLKAPFSGVVSGKYFEDGEIYTGAPTTSAGKPALLTIVQINQLKAQIGISSTYYTQVLEGMKAEVQSDLFPDIAFQGEVFRIYPTIDNMTKTFTVEIRIQNEKMKLRPGMFSKIKLHLGKGDAILIPTISVLKQTGTNDMYVYLYKEGKAIKQAVHMGRIIDDKTEILSGLKEGDEIIYVGQNKVSDQMSVKVVK